MSIVTYIKDKLGVKHEIGAKWDNVSGKPFTSVDSALSSTSTNPVQNNVVNTALAGKMEYKYSMIAIQSAVTDTTKRYWLAAYQTMTYTGNYNHSARFSLFQRGIGTETNRIDFGINCRSSPTAIGGISVRIENSVGLDSSTAEKMFYVTTEISGSTKTIRIYIDRTHNANYSWTTFTLQGLSFPYSDYGKAFASASNFIFCANTTVSGSNYGTCVDTMVGNVAVTTRENLYHNHSNYIPLQKTSIYGCKVKRAKNGGSWFDNCGFQIVESFASSFRTHCVTFRWESAAQMNGTTGRGCRRFLFGSEEIGRFLRCFVSEDDSYWYVWILFMNAKTGGALGSNPCSVMEMQSVPNGLEVLTTAPDLTNLKEIPWAADERYAPKSHTHAGTDVTSAVNYSKMQEAELLDHTKDIITEIKKINTRCVKWYRWNETSRPVNAPTNSARSLMQAIVQYENGVRITLIAYPQDTSEYYYITHYNGSVTTLTWRIAYTVPTSTYDATGTRAVNGTAVASAISGKANAASVTGATKCKVTYNSQGVITAGTDLAVSDIPNLAASKITSGTFADERIASASKWNAKQDDISDLIPTAASASNPLCDKAYADAIGERLEARYLGCNANGDPFATHAALTTATKFYYQGAETTPDTNDITTVIADEDHKNTSDVAGTTRYRYGGVDASGKPVWAFEYVINNTGLSQAQLLAVNSGITATKVTKYEGYATGKQDKLTEMTEQEVTDLINSLEA